MQARGEPVESQGEPFVSGGTPPKPIQRLELLAQVCQASPEIFQQAASDSAIDVQGAIWKQLVRDMWPPSQTPSWPFLTEAPQEGTEGWKPSRD